MRALSLETSLAVCEAGQRQHDLDRALTILGAALPEMNREQLAELTIGERDALLLRLRAATLGRIVNGTIECPACAQALEFGIDTAAFVHPSETSGGPPQLECLGFLIKYRLPNSRDAAVAVNAPSVAEGVRRLLDRCVVEARQGTNRVAARELPGPVIEALSRAMSERDPEAEIVIDLTCPECAHGWQAFFDIGACFWKELAARARRVLREIDAIARAYGWSEREILALGQDRRRSYMELIGA